MIRGASLSPDFTKEQLYSTASYQEKDLQGITLSSNDLTTWDFSGQNLTDASFRDSTLTDADMSGAVITRATLGDHFTKEQLYSTASYQQKNLQGIVLSWLNLTGCDFRGQNLMNADMWGANLANADLKSANLKNTNFTSANLNSAVVDGATVYNQWTVFPSSGFLPTPATLVISPAGDLDADDVLDGDDVDVLAEKIARYNIPTWWLLKSAFDLNNDSSIDLDDHRVWVKDLRHTWYGDANLDGEFNSGDLITVFQAGGYEDGIGYNSGWHRAIGMAMGNLTRRT